MKDKQKSFSTFINVIVAIVVILTLLSLVYTIWFNLKNNNTNFWNTSITNIISITIAIIFAYYFVQRKNDKRKQKEIIEKNIIKIQKYIYDEEIYLITSKENNSSLTRSIKIRKIKNLITYLSDYAHKFSFDDIMNEISKNFKEYQSKTESMIQDGDFTDKASNDVKRIIETLDDNLEELVHKIFL